MHMLGLSDGEVNVYLVSLQLGPESVQEIAKKTGLSRVSVYSSIEALTKLGLMTSVEKGKKQLYTAEPPERIVSLAENKVSRLKAMTEEIKDDIEELKLVQNGDKPIVKMFEGLEAFSAIQDDVLKTEIHQMCEFGNLDEINRVYPYEAKVRSDYLGKLAKRANMKRRLIFLSKNTKPNTIEDNKEIKYLDINKFRFFGDIFFYNDTVWISNFKNRQISVMIKNQEIKDTFQAAFEILWENTN